MRSCGLVVRRAIMVSVWVRASLLTTADRCEMRVMPSPREPPCFTSFVHAPTHRAWFAHDPLRDELVGLLEEHVARLRVLAVQPEQPLAEVGEEPHLRGLRRELAHVQDAGQVLAR